MGYASMTYAGKGILEEYFKDREKNKEPPSDEGGSGLSLIQHFLDCGENYFFISVL